MLADPGSTNIDANNIVDYIMSNYLAVGFKGAFVVSIMAMCMSTADSYINSASVLFSHDLLKSMGIYISEKWELFFVRITALFVGIAALMLSIFSQNLLDLMLSAYSFYMPVVSVPMILSIFGFRSSSTTVLLGMFAGFSTVCGFMIFAGVDNVVIPGMLANLIVYIASHYLLSKSGQWVGIKEKVALQEIQDERSNMVKGFFESIKRFSVYKYLKNSAFKQEATYVYIGFFCIISTFASLYSLPKIITAQHALLVHIISYGTLFLATILITYPAWMEKFKDQIFISFISHITIFTVLVVATSLLVLISHFSQLQIVILTASLITVAILLRWYTTLLYMITGIVVSGMYLRYISPDIAFGHITTEFTVLYVILMASAISVVFLKPKEDALEISEARSVDLWKKINEMDMALQKANNVKIEFLNNLSQEVRAPMTGITSLGQALWENHDFLPEAEPKKCVKTMAQTSDRLIGLINNILDLSSLSSLKLDLNLKKVNLSSLIHESIQKCMKLYLDKKALQFDIQIEKDVYLKCDEHYIGNTIDNLIINAISYSKPNTVIRIILHTHDGNISFSIRDVGMGIPTDELVDIFHPFTVSFQTSTLAGSRGVGLSLCYSAIIAHKGKIWAESDGKSWAEFKFTI